MNRVVVSGSRIMRNPLFKSLLPRRIREGRSFSSSSANNLIIPPPAAPSTDHLCPCGLYVCNQTHCPALHTGNWSSQLDMTNHPLPTNQQEQHQTIPILAPYQGSDWDNIDHMLELAQFQSGDRILDIGAGDGRILIRSIQRNASYAEGWEFHQETYDLGYAHISQSLSEQQLTKVKFIHGNGLNASLDGFDIVLLYLLPAGLEILAPKIISFMNDQEKNKEKKKCKIITQGWPIPNLIEIQKMRTSGGSTLYRYFN